MKKRSKAATDPFSLRLRFEHVRVRKALQHAREVHGGAGHDHPPHDPSSMPEVARTLLDMAIDAAVKAKWCSDAHNALDSGIKFLQDHHDQMTEAQREGFRNDLAGLLDVYGEHC